MNRLKKIFQALSELSAQPSPSKAIADAWAYVRRMALPHQDSVVPGIDPVEALGLEPRSQVRLLDKIIAAVCGIADDAGKKVKE